MWKITAYNGTEWESKDVCTILEAIHIFTVSTGLHIQDIKKCENLH